MGSVNDDLNYYQSMSGAINAVLGEFVGVATCDPNNFFSEMSNPGIVGTNMDNAMNWFNGKLIAFDNTDKSIRQGGSKYDRNNNMYISWAVYYRYNDLTNAINWNFLSNPVCSDKDGPVCIDPVLFSVCPSWSEGITPHIKNISSDWGDIRACACNHQDGNGNFHTQDTLYCVTRDWFQSTYFHLRGAQDYINKHIIPTLQSSLPKVS